MIKVNNNKLKLLYLIFIIITLSSCRYKDYRVEDVYGVIENGRVNRMGIPRYDLDKMNNIIRGEYGLRFRDWSFRDSMMISSRKKNDNSKNYYIKFYDNLIAIVEGEKYIILKKNIIEEEYSTDYPTYEIYDPFLRLPSRKSYNLILELGEIEIIDKDGNIIKERRKIPPLLFKKRFYDLESSFSEGFKNSDYIYDGWAEDYHKNKKKAIKDYNKFQERKNKAN